MTPIAEGGSYYLRHYDAMRTKTEMFIHVLGVSHISIFVRNAS